MTRLADRSFALCVGRIADNAYHSVMNGSTDVLEHILDHDSCNPDVRNRLNGDTPLHIAVRQRWEDHPGMRLYIGESWMSASLTLVGSLLEAGADML